MACALSVKYTLYFKEKERKGKREREKKRKKGRTEGRERRKALSNFLKC